MLTTEQTLVSIPQSARSHLLDPLGIPLTQLHRTSLPLCLTAANVSSCNVSAFRCGQSLTKFVNSPDQHSIRPAKTLHDFVLSTSAGSIGTLIRVFLEDRSVAFGVGELWDILCRSTCHTPCAVQRVKIALREFESKVLRPDIVLSRLLTRSQARHRLRRASHRRRLRPRAHHLPLLRTWVHRYPD